MTPEQAADLAERTLAAMDGCADDEPQAYADRERVASDLAGLRDCYGLDNDVLPHHHEHLRRYANNLRRTAALYGVTS